MAALIKFLSMLAEQWPATIIFGALGAWLGVLHARVSRIANIEANIDALRHEFRQQADRQERQIESLRREVRHRADRQECQFESLRRELHHSADMCDCQIEALHQEQQPSQPEQADKFDEFADRLENLVLRSNQPAATGQVFQSVPPSEGPQT